MTDRAAFEDLIRRGYAARVRGDVDGIVELFADHAIYSLAGSPTASSVPVSVAGIAPLRESMRRLVAAFHFDSYDILELIVEGETAVVHARARVRSAVSGEGHDTEIVDIIKFQGGKMVSYRQFADTALASRLLGQ